MKRISVLITACVLLVLFMVPASAAEQYLEVKVHEDGSFQVAVHGEYNEKLDIIGIYKQGETIDLSLPYGENPKPILWWVPPFQEPKDNRISYPGFKYMECYRESELLDGKGTPLKPGKYYAVAERYDVGTHQLLTEPVEFEIPEAKPALNVDAAEDGTITCNTFGYLNKDSTIIKVFKEGEAYDPKDESKQAAIIEWGLSQNDEPLSYPGNRLAECHRPDELVRGEKSPLKGGRYYAVAVDFINKEILVGPVAFEVPETATATAISTATPASTATGAEKAGSDDSAPSTMLWVGIGAAVIVVAAVVIIVVKSKKKQ